MAEAEPPVEVRLRPPQQPADGLATTQSVLVEDLKAHGVIVLPGRRQPSDVRMPTELLPPKPALCLLCRHTHVWVHARHTREPAHEPKEPVTHAMASVHYAGSGRRTDARRGHRRLIWLVCRTPACVAPAPDVRVPAQEGKGRVGQELGRQRTSERVDVDGSTSPVALQVLDHTLGGRSPSAGC